MGYWSFDYFQISIIRFKKFYNEELPGKDFYVNLFPTYATTAQLETDSYEEYIRKYIEIVKPDYVSYDHYALMEDGYGVKKITDDVLYNLEIVAKLCKEANIPMMTFVSTMCYGLGTREPWSVEEIRWQVMNELAYGSIGIQYFCYFTPLGAFTDECIAMIDHSGNRTDVYNRDSCLRQLSFFFMVNSTNLSFFHFFSDTSSFTRTFS